MCHRQKIKQLRFLPVENCKKNRRLPCNAQCIYRGRGGAHHTHAHCNSYDSGVY